MSLNWNLSHIPPGEWITAPLRCSCKARVNHISVNRFPHWRTLLGGHADQNWTEALSLCASQRFAQSVSVSLSKPSESRNKCELLYAHTVIISVDWTNGRFIQSFLWSSKSCGLAVGVLWILFSIRIRERKWITSGIERRLELVFVIVQISGTFD